MDAQGWAAFAAGASAVSLASVLVAWRKERMCYRLMQRAKDYYDHADELLSRQSNGKAKQ